MNNFWLTQFDYESRYNSWASAATNYCEQGYPVHYEGIDWTKACQDHGFHGAIQKVKAAYRLRRHQWLTAKGKPAETPISHTFYREESSEQITIEADSLETAAEQVDGGTYTHSIDSKGRFVFK